MNAYVPPEAAAAALRAGAPPEPEKAKKEGEEGISLFWRVFGGAIFSMGCLVLINVYQSLSTVIQEVRRDVNRLSETRSELIDKKDHSASQQQIWNRLQEVQTTANNAAALKDRLMLLEAERKDIQTLTTAVTAIQERTLARDAEIKALAEEIKRGDQGLQAALTGLKERLGTMDQQMKSIESVARQLDQSAKDVQALQTMLGNVQEKSLSRDATLKQIQDESKDVAKDLNALRERLAKFEGAVEAKASADKTPKARPASRPTPSVSDDPPVGD
jgi:DNA repair exonuclease SbcCD ATPase subunit